MLRIQPTTIEINPIARTLFYLFVFSYDPEKQEKNETESSNDSGPSESTSYYSLLKEQITRFREYGENIEDINKAMGDENFIPGLLLFLNDKGVNLNERDAKEFKKEFSELLAQFCDPQSDLIEDEQSKHALTSGPNSLNLYDALSERCLFGLLECLPSMNLNIYEDGTFYKEDAGKVRSEFIKSIPGQMQEFLTYQENESKDLMKEKMKNFTLLLCETLREHMLYKQGKPSFSAECDAYVKFVKDVLNKMASVFKERMSKCTDSQDKDREVYLSYLKAMGEGIYGNFERYIRSLVRKEFNMGLKSNDNAIVEKIRKDFPNKFKGELAHFGENICEEFEKGPDNCQTVVSNLKKLIESIYNEMTNENSSDANKENASDILKRLYQLIHKIELEYISFHTRGESHNGEFSIKNILLSLDDGGISKNIEFAQDLARQHMHYSFKKTAILQQKILTPFEFSTTLKEDLGNIWSAQLDSSKSTGVKHANDTLNKLKKDNTVISTSDKSDEVLDTTINYMNKTYKMLSGKNAIPNDSDFDKRFNVFNMALNDYRYVLNEYPREVKILSQSACKKAVVGYAQKNHEKTDITTLYCKNSNIHLSRSIQTELKSVTMIARDWLISFFTTKKDVAVQIKNLMKDLENCCSTQDHLRILRSLQECYADLGTGILANAHKELIQKSMVGIINRQILDSSDIRVKYSVKKRDLLETRALISCIKTDENAAEINNIVDRINENISKINQTTLKFDHLLLASHVEQEFKFKELLLKMPSNKKDNIKEQRLARFGQALAEKLTNASMANYVIASGQVVTTSSKAALAVTAVSGVAGSIIPVVGQMIDGGIQKGTRCLDQYTQVQSGSICSGNMANPVQWMNYVWEELVPSLMETFKDIVEKMEGTTDPERFAEFCKKRIMDRLQNKDYPFPAKEDKEARLSYITTAILMNRDVISVLPCLPTYMRTQGDNSWYFLEKSFEEIATNCKITSTDSKHTASQANYAFRKNNVQQTGYGTLYFSNPGTARKVAKNCGHNKIKPKVKMVI